MADRVACQNRIEACTEYLRELLKQIGAYNVNYMEGGRNVREYSRLAGRLAMIKLEHDEILVYISIIQESYRVWSEFRANQAATVPNDHQALRAFTEFEQNSDFRHVSETGENKANELKMLMNIYEARLGEIKSKMRFELFKRTLASVTSGDDPDETSASAPPDEVESDPKKVLEQTLQEIFQHLSMEENMLG